MMASSGPTSHPRHRQSPPVIGESNGSSAEDPYSALALKCLKVMEATGMVKTSDATCRQSSKPSAQRGNSPANDDNLGFYPLKLVLGNSDGDAKSERAMYDPLVELVSFIRQFYRDHDLSGDESWSRPRNPDPTAKPSAPNVTDSRPLE
ncbi:hypothetical protein FRB95_012304 [Tulasnella sp. JGI-2019a]|nr:hypothetical protein FRB95_012304 [Tulasnella sp. JGI-2019a]